MTGMINIKMMMTWMTLRYLGVDGDQKSTLAGAILLCCSPAAQIIIVIKVVIIFVVISIGIIIPHRHLV